MDTNKQKKLKQLTDVMAVFLVIIAVHFVVGAFNGKWPWSGNPYNSYLLQALSWLEGRLDLGQNYEYLELAIFNDKFFVSFPPFPSYVLLPFAIFFKERTPEGWIAFFGLLIGAFFALRIAWEYLGTGAKAVFWTCFLFLGTNVLYVTLDAGVWFIAQSFAITTSVIAIFYAIRGKGGTSLFFWGCSVGCRPLQVLYFPLLFYILYRGLKAKNPEKTFLEMIKKKFYWAIPVCLIAFSYMLLNYFRFGNPLEFGHNYLPEFTREEYGQFNIHYISQNLKTLFRLPVKSELGNGTLTFYKFDGNNIFLVIPMFVSYLIYFIRNLLRKQKVDWFFVIGIPVLVILHIITLCAHRTMGGFHFGHRYINDVLPYVFWGILLFASAKKNQLTTCVSEKICANETEHTDETDCSEEKQMIETSDINGNPDFSSSNLSEEEAFTPESTPEAITEPAYDYTYCLHFGLCALGLALNLVGTIATNMGWV